MHSIDLNKNSIEMLNQEEIDQVSGALAPLAIYGLIVGGGAVIGFAAAAAVHFFGNGKHAHAN